MTDIKKFEPKDLVTTFEKYGLNEIDCRVEHGFKDANFYLETIGYLDKTGEAPELLKFLIEQFS